VGSFFFLNFANPLAYSDPNVARAQAVTSSTTVIMKPSLLVVFLGFAASAYAASLTLQSPKFTVSSSGGEQIRSEPYVHITLANRRS